MFWNSSHPWTIKKINCLKTQKNMYIIMYIYHALISSLSTHMIHINLNMVFYTHVEHSPTKTTHTNWQSTIQKDDSPPPPPPPPTHTQITMNSNVHNTDLYHTSHTWACACTHTHTHTHTHNDCSRNWVLILVGAKILWEEGFQFGFKRWQGWAVSEV